MPTIKRIGPYRFFFYSNERDDPPHVHELSDGRSISVPLVWFPRLLHASAVQLENWALLGDGEGLHWPDIDEDICTENLLMGIPSIEYRRRP